MDKVQKHNSLNAILSCFTIDTYPEGEAEMI
jgi:hypothetical protein